MSNQIHVDESTFQNIKDKVVVVTGGANGIGEETVVYLVNAGARVVFGDFDTDAGERLARRFSAAPNAPTFVTTDVSKYEDNLTLIKTAFEKHGRLDHGVVCAGILEKGEWFDPSLTIESVEQPETNQVIEVNLLGALYFTRIALVYLRHGRQKGEDKSLVIISSAAGFRDSPGLPLYQCSKHGVLGLVRSTRKTFRERDNVRINAVCPGLTDTAMTVDVTETFRRNGHAINTAQDVAKYIIWMQADRDVTGKAVYVEGGRAWEFLDGLDGSMDTWLGPQPTEGIKKALVEVGQGTAWNVKGKSK